MIKFLIKKSFFGGWDNLIPQFLYNIATMSLLTAFLFAYTAVEESAFSILIPILAGFLLLYCVLIFGIGGITKNWSEYQSSWGTGFGLAIKNHIPHIILFYLVALFCVLNIVVLIPFYLGLMNFFGLFVAFLQVWVTLFLLIALQYYIPLCMFLEDKKAFFIFKQCFALFFDNVGFSLFVSIKTVFDFLLSALSFFFIPGFTFINLSHMDAVNLLHQRYRWAKEHNIPKKSVNIYEMLEEERNNMGVRNIRNFFRPWKTGK